MRLVRLLLISTLGLAGAAHAASTVASPHVTVSLAAEQTRLVPGEPAVVGVHFALEPHWHVYWSNPGDSGEAPSIAWAVPRGFTVGPLAWPAPRHIPVGPLANYGYEGAVLLAATLTVPHDARVGTSVPVAADVSWLVCRAEECIPGTAKLELPLKVGAAGADAAPSSWAAAFAATRTRLPAPSRPAELRRAGDAIVMRVRDVGAPAGAPVAFFPEVAGVIEPAAPQRVHREDGVLEVTLTRSAARTADVPAELPGVVTVGSGDETTAYRVVAAPPTASLALALVLAAAGGLLLNLMPCVFPVLSLKVLSFVQQAGAEAARVRAHGWAFTAGVLVSFWLLAGMLLVLRAGGEQLGWGFQLQTPAVVAALAALMLLLGLNLAGVFEIGLGLTAAGGMAPRTTGLWGSFWTGALATTVATPCTAPFMGAALGVALTRPASEAMLIFTALAAGMAAPYLALAYAPSALRLLPRPGAWMQTLKTLLSLPLFATALWLVWVFQLQLGNAAAGMLCAALVALGVGTWLWGAAQAAAGGAMRRRLAAALLLAVALPLGAAASLRGADGAGVAAEDDFWSAWSPEREDALRASGTPIFVNYTAAWCLTCQVNERLVFASTDVRDAFRRAGVAALKADWTDRSDAVARSLDRHGRSGVPLYLLYAGEPGTPARILPQLPTRAEVIRALTTTPSKEES